MPGTRRQCFRQILIDKTHYQEYSHISVRNDPWLLCNPRATAQNCGIGLEDSGSGYVVSREAMSRHNATNASRSAALVNAACTLISSDVFRNTQMGMRSLPR